MTDAERRWGVTAELWIWLEELVGGLRAGMPADPVGSEDDASVDRRSRACDISPNAMLPGT